MRNKGLIFGLMITLTFIFGLGKEARAISLGNESGNTGTSMPVQNRAPITIGTDGIDWGNNLSVNSVKIGNLGSYSLSISNDKFTVAGPGLIGEKIFTGENAGINAQRYAELANKSLVYVVTPEGEEVVVMDPPNMDFRLFHMIGRYPPEDASVAILFDGEQKTRSTLEEIAGNNIRFEGENRAKAIISTDQILDVIYTPGVESMGLWIAYGEDQAEEPIAKEIKEIDVKNREDWEANRGGAKAAIIYAGDCDISSYDTLMIEVEGKNGTNAIVVQLLSGNDRQGDPVSLSNKIPLPQEGSEKIEIPLKDLYLTDSRDLNYVVIHYGDVAWDMELGNFFESEIDIKSIKFVNKGIEDSVSEPSEIEEGLIEPEEGEGLIIDVKGNAHLWQGQANDASARVNIVDQQIYYKDYDNLVIGVNGLRDHNVVVQTIDTGCGRYDLPLNLSEPFTLTGEGVEEIIIPLDELNPNPGDLVITDVMLHYGAVAWPDQFYPELNPGFVPEGHEDHTVTIEYIKFTRTGND